MLLAPLIYYFSTCLVGYRTIALLHLLIVECQDINFDLHTALRRARRRFPGIEHMFVATMSWFSFCDIPQIQGRARFYLENAAGALFTCRLRGRMLTLYHHRHGRLYVGIVCNARDGSVHAGIQSRRVIIGGRRTTGTSDTCRHRRGGS